jgi:hypothetical protein
MIDYSKATPPQFFLEMTNVSGRRQQFEAVLATTRYLANTLLDVTEGKFFVNALTTKVDMNNKVYVLKDIQVSPRTRQEYISCEVVVDGKSRFVYVLLTTGSSGTTLGYRASGISGVEPN